MKKRILSLMIVLVLLCTFIPQIVFAENIDKYGEYIIPEYKYSVQLYDEQEITPMPAQSSFPVKVIEPPTPDVSSGQVIEGTEITISSFNEGYIAYSINGSEFEYVFEPSITITITEDTELTLKAWVDYIEEGVAYETPEATYKYTVLSDVGGECGENVTWKLAGTTLTISGTGDMTDYEINSDAPWFSMNYGIKTVNIESGVTHIGSFAFSEYENLKTVMIPKSVTSIGESAFYACYGLRDLFYGAGMEEWDAIEIGNDNECLTNARTYYVGGECGENVTWVLNMANGTLTISGVGNMRDFEVFGSPWFELGRYIQESIETVNIENGVTSVGDFSFYHLKNLKSVSLPEGILNIGRAAFDNCDNLTDITIPQSVISIEEDAFNYCESLESITIPQSVTSIGEAAFYGCTNLEGIEVAPDNTTYSSESGVLFNKDKTELICCPGGKTGEYTVPDTVTTILNYAFYLCYKLESIEVTSNNTTYSSESGALFNKDKTELICCPGGKTGEYVIPDTVTSIRDYAFDGCDNLKNITLPQGITSIGEGIFSYCESLESIDIPDSVKSMGDYAFDNCTSLKSIDIPDGVTSIGIEAFNSCTSLENVNIPDSVTSIGSYAFSGCRSLETIKLPEGLTTIEYAIFDSCSNLMSVTIPQSVTSIESYAFYDCNRLEDVYYGGSEEQWGSVSIGFDNDALKNATIHYAISPVISGECGENLTWVLSDHNLTISGTGEMYDYDYDSEVAPWFSNNESIESVNIESGVTSIGNFAFSDCAKLKSINIADSVTSIGNYSFDSCKSLVSLTIPDSVTNIGQGAFQYCNRLTSIDISKNITIIASQTFFDCTKLVSVNIPEGVTSIGNNAFDGCTALENINVPKSVTSIGEYAFDSCESLVSINIPDGITSIADNVFYECYKLKSIDIPESVTNIGENAFYCCESLENIDIPKSVVSIDNGAFCGCESLVSVTIPDGITSIKSRVFSGCINLSDITIPQSVTSINDYAFYMCDSIDSITLPDKLTNIGDYAFAQCGKLSDITMPDGVLSIGNAAFASCISLVGVNIPDSVTDIGTGTFSDCSNLAGIAIPDGIEKINEDTFSGCLNLKVISIPASVKTIGNNAFASCSNITEVYYGSDEEHWESINIYDNNDALMNAEIHYSCQLPTEASMKYENGTLTVTLPTAQVADLILAFYENGSLDNCQKLERVFNMGTTSISLESLMFAHGAKIMLWNENMEPLCDAVEIQ